MSIGYESTRTAGSM